MKFVDADNKEITKTSRNYFFVGTIAIVSITILLHAVLGSRWELKLWDAKNAFLIFLNGFFGCFAHHNWQHVLLNMLCFLVCGLYLERKLGTLKLLAIIGFLCFFSRFVILSVLQGRVGAGFSNVNYALYGFIIMGFIFELVNSVKDDKMNTINIMLGVIIVILIVITFFFSGGTDGFKFASYPYDLMQETHWPGFIVGIMTALLIQINWKDKAKI